MKEKLITKKELKKLFHDNMTMMIGGFASVGTPEVLIDAIVESGVKGLTVISNDSTHPEQGLWKLISKEGVVAKLIASHIGMNPLTGTKMNEGTLPVELIPQGSLAEKIRAGGAGLGGILTQTGLGTEVEEEKERITVDGVEFLLEKPLRADIALIRGSIVDKKGNIMYKGTTQNFNPLMAMAADLVIVEAEDLVEVGAIEPENVRTPGILVNYIVRSECHE
mgnify:CR=1 FL=1